MNAPQGRQAGKRLTLYLGESDRWRGRSLYMSILEALRDADIAGATVTRGLAGFGAHSIVRTNAIETLSMDLPITIAVIDTPQNVDRALALIGPMVREGLITLEDVEIVKYTHRHLEPLPADQPVHAVMTRDVVSVPPGASARDVVELLLGKMFRAIPVVDASGGVLGIITESDLLQRAGMPLALSVGGRLTADDLHGFLARISRDRAAAQIMSQPVQTVREDDSLGHAVQTMLRFGRKRLPVVDDGGHLVGMLSRLDVLRAVAGAGASGQPPMGGSERAPQPRAGRTIGDLLSPDAPTVHVDDDLVDILQKLIAMSVRFVVVLDHADRPAGVITDGDLVARVSPTVRGNVIQALAARILDTALNRGAATARSLMSERALTAPPDTTVVDAIALMLRDGRKRLAVVDEDGRLLGTVDRQTLLAASLSV